MKWEIALLTISDRIYRGEVEDQSTEVIQQLLSDKGIGDIVEYKILPDETDPIAMAMIELCDIRQVDLILTTGGTGFSPRHITPEATLRVIERVAPGLAEAMRHTSILKTPSAMLTRGVAGIRKSTLIINLPGSPLAVYECLEVIIDQLDRALKLLKGGDLENTISDDYGTG